MNGAEAPFTVRIEGVHVIVSSDDGTTAAAQGAAAALQSVRRQASTGRRGVLTAAALGTLAEARLLRPEATPSTEPLPEWPGLRHRRVTRAAVTPVDQALLARRSERRLVRCHVTEVVAVLRAVALITTVRADPGGGQEPLRPVPSAGARHPIDVVVAAGDIEGLASGWWRFDPWRGDLVEIELATGSQEYLEQLRVTTGADTPPAALVLVASFARTLTRYPAGSSLVWRDAGVMAGYLHLSASSRGLASCILSPVGLALPGGGRDGVCDLGCVVVGRAPSQASDR